MYRKHAPAAFRRAQRILANDADAHEIVHDVFLSLLERPEQYQGGSNMSSLLYSSVTHACLNRIRNQKHRLRLVREHAAPQPSGVGMPEQPRQWAMLRAALDRLPDEAAQAALYWYIDGLAHTEIARLLGCSPRHVSNLLERLPRWTQGLATSDAEAQRCSG